MPTRTPDPIIVLGAPRSGTTYLRAVLNSHPDVFVSHETRVFVWAHQALRVLPEDRQALLTHRDRFVDHISGVVREAIRDFYSGLAPKVTYWGDKNPHYASPRHRGCLETIQALFPGAKFLHIYRDGRDVVTSLMRRGWADFEGSHRTWEGHVRVAREFGTVVGDGSYFEVRYEQFIADDEGVAGQLFEFLGIPMHPATQQFCRDQTRSRTPLSAPTTDVTTLETAAPNAAWNTMFESVAERERSLSLLGPTLTELGYPVPERG
ncbi:MAG: sulfotransferase [Actinobacteria bacterium]|nr:sulfotransferase [Actinomycetota bacterium]